MMKPAERLFSSVLKKPSFGGITNLIRPLSTTGRRSGRGGGDDEWNDAWESAWLPDDEDVAAVVKRAPWETDVNFSLADYKTPTVVLPNDVDSETKAFVEDMTENWDQRRGKSAISLQNQQNEMVKSDSKNSLYGLENIKRDYRVKKQRIHSGLWMKEIEKQEEAKLDDSISAGPDHDIDKLLDVCSDIFDTPNDDLNNSKVASLSEYNNKPPGWETTSKAQDGNIWEMSQREEDILVQEFERRIAFNKFKIASFIKTHIFSRRRPIDGWKFMIEELGPNAKRGQGSVSRLPSLSDASTQPFKEEKLPLSSGLPSHKRM